MEYRLVLLCAAIGAVVDVALAQQKSEAESLQQRFKQLDKNADGKITTDEVPMSPFFKQRDKNGDGVITLAELMADVESVGKAPAAAAATKAIQQPAAPVEKSRPKSVGSRWRQGPQPVNANQFGVGRLAP